MRSLSLWLQLVLVVCLTGCTSRFTHDRRVDLDVSGPVGLDVETFRGDVIIRSGSETIAPRVLVVRESTHGHMRKDDAIAALEQVDYTVQLVNTDLGPVVQVRTFTSHAEPYFLKANVYVDLPVVDGVRIRTEDGKVEARDVQGTLDIQTTSENVMVATIFPMTDPITIRNDQGDIDLRIRGESRGELKLESVGGRVFHAIKYGQTIVHGGTDENTLLASFNEGLNPIVLETVDADVRFNVGADPHGFGLVITD